MRSVCALIAYRLNRSPFQLVGLSRLVSELRFPLVVLVHRKADCGLPASNAGLLRSLTRCFVVPPRNAAIPDDHGRHSPIRSHRVIRCHCGSNMNGANRFVPSIHSMHGSQTLSPVFRAHFSRATCDPAAVAVSPYNVPRALLRRGFRIHQGPIASADTT